MLDLAFLGGGKCLESGVDYLIVFTIILFLLEAQHWF